MNSINMDLAWKSISHREGWGVVMCKDAVIYSNIDTGNRADPSPVCVSGRGRDIKNSYGDGRRCHIEYVASCSDDHRKWAVWWWRGNMRLLLWSSKWHHHWGWRWCKEESAMSPSSTTFGLVVFIKIFRLFYFLCISLCFSFCISIIWLRQMLHKPPRVSCLPCNNLSCGLFNLIIKLHLWSPKKMCLRASDGSVGMRAGFTLSGHNTIPTVDKTPLIKYLKMELGRWGGVKIGLNARRFTWGF